MLNEVAKSDLKSPIVECAIIKEDEWCLRCHCDGSEGCWTAWLECDRPRRESRDGNILLYWSALAVGPGSTGYNAPL